VRFQIQHHAGYAALRFGDADLFDQRIAYRDGLHLGLAQSRAGVLNIEEEAVGIGKSVGAILEAARDLNGNAGEFAQRPETYRRDLTGRRRRSGETQARRQQRQNSGRDATARC
jgi:hypothetical protein